MRIYDFALQVTENRKLAQLHKSAVHMFAAKYDVFVHIYNKYIYGRRMILGVTALNKSRIAIL